MTTGKSILKATSSCFAAASMNPFSFHTMSLPSLSFTVLIILNVTTDHCRKKADWYLCRDLAALLPEDKAIKLLFVAKGDGHAEGDYMVEDKANICVSCGASKALTLHHIGKNKYNAV
jgi:hypothetical protein